MVFGKADLKVGRGEMMERMGDLRAQWLVQLSEAIEGAQRVAWQLGAGGGSLNEARELYRRLEAVRLEIEGLRAAGGPTLTRTADPDWLQMLGWSSAVTEHSD